MLSCKLSVRRAGVRLLSAANGAAAAKMQTAKAAANAAPTQPSSGSGGATVAVLGLAAVGAGAYAYSQGMLPQQLTGSPSPMQQTQQSDDEPTKRTEPKEEAKVEETKQADQKPDQQPDQQQEKTDAKAEAQADAKTEVGADKKEEKLGIKSEPYDPSLPRPQIVFVLGGPGAGKGTQCERLVNTFGVVHLSAGDLLRAERNDPNSQFGALIDDYIKRGAIVPVDITVNLLRNAMLRTMRADRDSKQKIRSTFLVDGFPRNEDNLQGWHRVMDDMADVAFTLFVDVEESVMEQRLLGRAEKARQNGQAVRKDDNKESIRKRFRTYTESTMPIIEHFDQLNLVRRVDGGQSPDDVFNTLSPWFKALVSKQSESVEELREQLEQERAEKAKLVQEHADLERAFDAKLSEYEAALRTRMNEEIEAKIAEKSKELEKVSESERAERVVEIEQLRRTLAAFESALLQWRSDDGRRARIGRACLHALRQLEQVLKDNDAMARQSLLRALCSAAEATHDDVLRAIVQALPVLKEEDGKQMLDDVPTQRMLENRFRRVERAIQEIALITDAGVPADEVTFMNRLVAKLVSSLMADTRDSDLTKVPSGDSAAAKLARARFFLVNGVLALALDELESLPEGGEEAELVRDFLLALRQRVLLQQCGDFLEAELLCESAIELDGQPQ